MPFAGQALESERKALVMEIEMMKDIGYHRHVVSMLACCTRDDYLALVMEYVPYGNLQSFLKKNRAESEVCSVSTVDYYSCVIHVNACISMVSSVQVQL